MSPVFVGVCGTASSMEGSLVAERSRKRVGVNEGSTSPFIDAEGCRIGEEIGRSECATGNSATASPRLIWGRRCDASDDVTTGVHLSAKRRERGGYRFEKEGCWAVGCFLA
jgi:hypothetical protein